MIEKTIILTNPQRPAKFSNRVRPICLPIQVLHSLNMRSSSGMSALSKEILLYLSIIKLYLINSPITIPYSPPHYQKSHGSIFLAALKYTNFDVVCVGCGPLWRTSHCGRLGQVRLLLSYVFGGIKSLRVHECKNAPFILFGAEKSDLITPGLVDTVLVIRMYRIILSRNSWKWSDTFSRTN